MLLLLYRRLVVKRLIGKRKSGNREITFNYVEFLFFFLTILKK